MRHLDRTALPKLRKSFSDLNRAAEQATSTVRDTRESQGRLRVERAPAPSAVQGLARECLRDNFVITLAVAPLTKLSSFVRRRTALRIFSAVAGVTVVGVTDVTT
jgi:hypothetical protein